MRVVDPILQEIEQESRTTRRVLERVPESKLAWKPAETSMSLGQLAMHIAGTSGFVAGMIAQDNAEFPSGGTGNPSPESIAQLLSVHDQSKQALVSVLSGMDDLAATAIWRLSKGGHELMAVPKIAFVRLIAMNHIYHHRGQLSVYLRMLDVKVPSIYGPSADENPFA